MKTFQSVAGPTQNVMRPTVYFLQVAIYRSNTITTTSIQCVYYLYCTPRTPTAGMTHSLNSNWSFLVVILSWGKESPLSAYAFPLSNILLYLPILRQHWAAYWTQMMNGCGLMADSRPPLIDTAVSLHLFAFVFLLLLLLFFSQHGNPLRFRLVALKKPYVPAWSIVMKYTPQEIAQGLFSRVLFFGSIDRVVHCWVMEEHESLLILGLIYTMLSCSLIWCSNSSYSFLFLL